MLEEKKSGLMFYVFIISIDLLEKKLRELLLLQVE